MAIEVGMDDDLFFADLNRQITLLIDEDEDEDHVSHFGFISPQRFSRTIIHPPILPSQYNLYQQNCGNQMSKGTGVFIPQSSQQRRRYKQQGKRTGAGAGAGAGVKQFITNSKSRSNNNCGAYATSINRS